MCSIAAENDFFPHRGRWDKSVDSSQPPKRYPIWQDVVLRGFDRYGKMPRTRKLADVKVHRKK